MGKEEKLKKDRQKLKKMTEQLEQKLVHFREKEDQIKSLESDAKKKKTKSSNSSPKLLCNLISSEKMDTNCLRLSVDAIKSKEATSREMSTIANALFEKTQAKQTEMPTTDKGKITTSQNLNILKLISPMLNQSTANNCGVDDHSSFDTPQEGSTVGENHSLATFETSATANAQKLIPQKEQSRSLSKQSDSKSPEIIAYWQTYLSYPTIHDLFVYLSIYIRMHLLNLSRTYRKNKDSKSTMDLRARMEYILTELRTNEKVVKKKEIIQ
ncbi:hypothetical protein RFI_19276, partial [Reticulomyxa filosa]